MPGGAVGAHVDAFAAGHAGEPDGARVVGAEHHEAAAVHGPDELLEGPVDRRPVGVVVEVVRFDVGHDRRVRAVGEKRPIALVGFEHEQVAAAVVGVAARLVEVAADRE